MSDDIEALQKLMLLPEFNKAVFSAHIDECMAPAPYVGEMKVLTVVMRETPDA